MKQILDKIDKKIIYELDLNARIPETILAKKIKKSRETIRYRIKQLEKKGIITGYSLYTNPTKIGYQPYKIYLKLSGKKERRDELIKYIKNLKNLFWLGVADGSWDIGITTYEKKHSEYFNKINSLIEEFKDIIIKKDFGIVIDIHVYPKKFFTNGIIEPKILFGKLEFNKIDELDIKILNILNKNSKEKFLSIANQLNVSIDIIRSRIKKMEKEGLILQYRVNIDYNKLGYEFFKAFLYFKHYSKENEMRLYEFCRTNSNVLNYVKQIMPWDAEIEVMAHNYMEFYKIINELRDIFPEDLINIETALMNEDYVFPRYG